MERVKIFIQKIQELYYSKHPKSAIDIDLMLDYTRVMYIDLLEWRKDFTEPVHSDIDAVIQAHPAAEKEEEATQQAQETTVHNAPEPETEAGTDNAATSMAAGHTALTEPETTVSTTETERMQPEPDPKLGEQQTEQEESEPEMVHEFPEEESISALSQESTGISFEAPVQVERSVPIGDVLVEEAPLKTTAAVEIPAATPAELPLPEIKPYQPPKLFDSIIETKDIRTSIGINDKYLFLNELFNNHKSNYEETLDKVNQLKTLGEARDWVKTKVAANLHWDDNDGTVQSFYALLEKHFSAK